MEIENLSQVELHTVATWQKSKIAAQAERIIQLEAALMAVYRGQNKVLSDKYLNILVDAIYPKGEE